MAAEETVSYVLGLDSSTQSLKVAVYNTKDFTTAYQTSINFDKDLPEFGTNYGVIKSDDGLQVTAPTLMFVKALDLALTNLKYQSCPFNQIVAVSGSGQQHGSVWFRLGALKILSNISNNPDKTLFDQLSNISNNDNNNATTDSNDTNDSKTNDTNNKNNNVNKSVFSLANGPIWMDSSTTTQCRNLETSIGSPQKVADISGSRAYERFTGNQIAKYCNDSNGNISDLYKNTERISLVSSFMATLFIGTEYAPIDVSDGSGMNLLDINGNTESKSEDEVEKSRKYWSDELLNATVDDMIDGVNGLKAKLGDKVAFSHEVIGVVNKYFVDRYNFNPECKIIAFSGDNPCSLAGLCVSTPNDVCVSLGTSDTLFGITEDPKPSGIEGHILCSPIHLSSYMIMLCYKNGSVAREYIRNEYFKDKKDILDDKQLWTEFNKVLKSSNPGNDGKLGFYFIEPEIIPPCKPGIYRFDKEDKVIENDGKEEDNSNIIESDIRGIVESQFLSMRQHMESIGLNLNNCSNIIATGGASQNTEVLQVLSDVFNANVKIIKSGFDTAMKGAGLRAYHGYVCDKNNKFLSFKEVCDNVMNSDDMYVIVSQPNIDNFKIYTDLMERRAKLESTLPKL